MSVVEETPTTLRRHVAPIVLEPVKRSSDGSLKVRGTAIVYNTPSPRGNLPYREVIRPGAFAHVLNDPATDLLLLFGHDRNRPLARQSARNLTVRDTSKGIEFEAELVNTSDGRDVYELLRQRVVKGCSFSFIPDPKSETWDFRDGEEWVTVDRVAELRELTLTADPVYTTTEAEARSSSVLDELRRQRISVRENGPYGPGSPSSWFCDLALVTEAMRNWETHVRSGGARMPAGRFLPMLDSFVPLARMSNGRRGPDAALARLRKVETQRRDLTTAALSGAFNSLIGVPEFIATTFATAARARALLAPELQAGEIPMSWIVPSSFAVGQTVSTGAGVAVQAAENTAVQETDPAGTGTAIKAATISGQIDASRQLVERGIDTDVYLARELGAAHAAALEDQIISGSGAAGQTVGLRSVSGAVAVTYTDATPSQAELWPFLMQARSQASASGQVPAVIVLHPRRRSWLLAALDTANAWAGLDPPLRAIEHLAIPTNLGAGTNEDVILIISPSLLPLLTRPIQVGLLPEPNAPQSLRFTAWSYAALHAMQPKAVAIIGGTGLVAPAGY